VLVRAADVRGDHAKDDAVIGLAAGRIDEFGEGDAAYFDFPGPDVNNSTVT
jgi:hypothetical protein